ncbi:MAG: tetratricopeptide repeat protein [Myxococcota bacterium]
MTESSEPSTLRPSGESTLVGDETEARPAKEESRPLGAGMKLGRYVVLEPLGRGAMGVVYAVYDPKLDRRIALKVLPPGSYREEHDTRLLREAQALARLSHPNVVAVHDVGTVDDQIFVAMEYLEGQDLWRWGKREHTWSEVLRIYVQAGRGLEAVHAAGLVHRDFKPENAFLGADGRVRVLDFGLALADEAVLDSDVEPPSLRDLEQEPETSLSSRITRAGAVVGTPAYMAPEQFLGGKVDAHSDQFSFCVALFEALYGDRPYEGKSAATILRNVLHGGIREAPRASKVPRWLREALVRGLAPSAEERWPSMAELLAQLTRDRTAPWRRWATVGLGVVAVAAVGWGVTRSSDANEPSLPTACTDAGQGLVGVWDPARREALSTRIADVKTPFAADMASRVVAQLDRYAESWVEMTTDACMATHVRGEQSDTLLDLRTACLDRRRAELETFVDTLLEADEKMVERSATAASGLSAIASCGDRERLQAAAPPPEDPVVAAEVEGIRTGIARVQGIFKAGRYADAAAEARHLRRRAELTKYGPVAAETALLVGRASQHNGESEVAAAALRDAVWKGTAHHADETVAEAATQLVLVLGFDQADPDEGLRWVDHARAAITRAGDDPFSRMSLRSAIGTVHFGRRDWEEARKAYEASAELSRQLSEEAQMRALAHLGNVAVQQGRYDEAIDNYRESADKAESLLGEHHPVVAQRFNNLGIAYERLKDYAQAERHYLQALELKQRLIGERHPSVGGTLGNLGNVALARESWAAAHDYFSRALDIFRVALPPGHPHQANCLLALSRASTALGKFDRAQREIDDVAKNLEQRSGDRRRDEVKLVMARADLAFERGTIDDAVALGTKALALAEEIEDLDPEMAKQAATWLAEAQAQ